MDPKASFEKVAHPSKGRRIRDVLLDGTSQPLTRPSEEEYREVAKKVKKAFEKGQVPVIIAPMGSGKSTRLAFYIYELLRKTINIIVPSVLLANDLEIGLSSALSALKKDRKFSGYSTGSSIDGKINKQHVNVCTPAYLNPKEGITVLDEFQNLTSFNLKDISNVESWKNMVLMSATAYNPVLACVR